MKKEKSFDEKIFTLLFASLFFLALLSIWAALNGKDGERHHKRMSKEIKKHREEVIFPKPEIPAETHQRLSNMGETAEIPGH